MKGAGLSFSWRTVSGLLTTSWVRRRQPAPRPARHPGGRADGVHKGVHRCPYPWDVLGGLAFGASVALLGWLLLGRPLTGLASRPRRQPGLNAFFAEHEGTTPLPIPASCRLSMTGLINQILSAPTWTVLAMVALIVFVEDALFVGFVIPGETAAIVGGVAASLGHAPLAAVVAVVIAAAIVGDSVGYEVGRQMGPGSWACPSSTRGANVWTTPRTSWPAGRGRGLPRPLGRVLQRRHADPGRHRPHALPQVPRVNAASGILWGTAARAPVLEERRHARQSCASARLSPGPSQASQVRMNSGSLRSQFAVEVGAVTPTSSASHCRAHQQRADRGDLVGGPSTPGRLPRKHLAVALTRRASQLVSRQRGDDDAGADRIARAPACPTSRPRPSRAARWPAWTTGTHSAGQRPDRAAASPARAGPAPAWSPKPCPLRGKGRSQTHSIRA